MASSLTLLDAVATATTGQAYRVKKNPISIQVFNNAAGTTNTVIIEGSNQETPTAWTSLLQFAMASNSETAGDTITPPWTWIRARASVVTAGAVSAIAGVHEE